jgi:hypothetical protein
MKIKIQKVVEDDTDILINFDSKIGTGIGYWKNRNKPIVGNEYDAEFNFEKVIEKGKNAFDSPKKTYAIEIKDEFIFLVGTIENIDDDGLAYFRLAVDCIIMIETEQGSFKLGDWITLKSEIKDFEIYAQGM